MLQEFVLWTQAFIAGYGLFGAFIIAVLESFIFPVPTAVFIAPMAALGVDPFVILIVSTIGSVTGAVIGYILGLKLGRPAAEKLFKGRMKSVEKWFDRYGAWAVLIAAFTPIPFKVFTWAGGIFRVNFRYFLAAAAVGRFFQFAIAAYAGSILGPLFLALLGISV